MTLIINNIVNINREIKAFQPGIGRKDFNSTATTYGQLRAELEEQGFNLEDVTVSEGYTKLTLSNDEAILPTNVNFRGNITNDLVILITPNEKPKAGASTPKMPLSRPELLSTIKEIRENSEEGFKFFAKYTNKSTVVLAELLSQWYEMDYDEDEQDSPKELVNATADSISDISQQIAVVIQNIIDKNTPSAPSIDVKAYNDGVAYILHGIELLQNVVSSKQEVSEEDIMEMFQQVK